MAPGDEYAAVGGGGKLKLKGLKVREGRVEKKKKKKEKKKSKEDNEGREDSDTTAAALATTSGSPSARGTPGLDEEGQEGGGGSIAKTEAERKYEEVRRKRLQERLKREGIKTHKERVEELNKYLSRLSEHHDMPRIGPG